MQRGCEEAKWRSSGVAKWLKKHLNFRSPTPPLPRSPAPLLTFTTILLVYLSTMPLVLTQENYGGDGGELITAAMTLGVPHPPGYPTYVLLGHLVGWLPWQTAVIRFNIFSAVTVAATAAILVIISQKKGWTAVIPAFIFAFTPLVWQQAIITEVYGLNLLMIAFFLWAVHKKRIFLIGIFLGLSITTHLTSLFLLPLALIITRPSRWKRFTGGLFIGLLPLSLLPLLAHGNSPIVWGDPTTIRGWWWLISGKLYHPNAFALPLTAVISRILSWLHEGFWQVMLLTPLTLLATRHSHTRMATAVLYILYAFTYHTNDSIVLILPAILLLATLLPHSKWLLPVPILLLLLNFNALALHNTPSSRLQAVSMLQTAPIDAILLTEGDNLIFDLWYYQQAEHIRPDLLLVDADLLAFDWYRARLGRLHPKLKALAIDNLDAFERENDLHITQINAD